MFDANAHDLSYSYDMSSGEAWARYARWVVIDGLAHRPDPERVGATFCGCNFGTTVSILRRPPRKLPSCRHCHDCVRAARRQAETASVRTDIEDSRVVGSRRGKPKSASPSLLIAESVDSSDLSGEGLRAALARERRQRARMQAAEAADRRASAADRSSSIQTVQGGLPTLGRHHR